MGLVRHLPLQLHQPRDFPSRTPLLQLLQRRRLLNSMVSRIQQRIPWRRRTWVWALLLGVPDHLQWEWRRRQDSAVFQMQRLLQVVSTSVRAVVSAMVLPQHLHRLVSGESL